MATAYVDKGSEGTVVGFGLVGSKGFISSNDSRMRIRLIFLNSKDFRVVTQRSLGGPQEGREATSMPFNSDISRMSVGLRIEHTVKQDSHAWGSDYHSVQRMSTGT